jgi:DeoR family transcriptional regulator, aga operon transcriptional repressor
MSSKTDERANKILRLLLSHGKTSVEELTSRFDTSPASVRRDLARLEARGLVHRTHGGAMLADQAVYEPFRFDESFATREDRFAKEKRRIAAAAAEMIGEGETVGFSAGTTTAQVARLLKHRKRLNVVTNAVNICLELGSNTGVNTILTGGSLRWPGAFSLVGPTAVESLRAFSLQRVFVGVCGVDAEHGASIIEPEEAAVVRSMVRQARQVVVVADSSKTGQCSPALICPVDAIDLLITDDGISPEVLGSFAGHSTRVLVV